MPSIKTRSTEFTSSRTRVIKSPVARLSNQLQRQQLDVRIKIAAQIENDALLERVVEQDAQRIEYVLKNKRERGGQRQRHEPIRACPFALLRRRSTS